MPWIDPARLFNRNAANRGADEMPPMASNFRSGKFEQQLARHLNSPIPSRPLSTTIY